MAASGWLRLTVLAPSRLRPSVAPERKRSPAESFFAIGRVLKRYLVSAVMGNCLAQVDHAQQSEDNGLDN